MMVDDDMSLKSYLDADWSRLHAFGEQRLTPRRWSSNFSPRFAPVFLIRVAMRLYAKGWKRLAKLTSLLNFLLFSIEVPARLSIGPGLVIPHSVGTILGARAIGKNVTIYQQVTLGAKVADFDFIAERRPLVSDGAIITAGAKVIGPVIIGENAIIGANAVILDDVPNNHIAVGVPAISKPRLSGDNPRVRKTVPPQSPGPLE